MISSSVAAGHSGDTIVVDGSGSGDFTEIQAAIDHASPGETIEVASGTYEEAIVIDQNTNGDALDGLTIEAAADDVTVDASGQDTTIVDVQAEDVTLDGLTLVWEGSPGEASITGIDAGGQNTLISDVQIDLPAVFCEVQDGACDAPKVTGVNARAATTVQDSTITTDVVDEGELSALGTRGVNVLADGEVSVENSEFSGWGAGVQNWRPGVSIVDSVFTLNFRGVHIAADSVEITSNVFNASDAAVYVAGSSDFAPVNVTLRGNELGLENNKAIDFEADKTGSQIDARWNHWGVVKEEVIENTRIGWTSDTAENRDNDIDLHPYLDENGEQIPPEPVVHCFTGSDETLSPIAQARTLQEAIDLDLPSDCVDKDNNGVVHRTIVLEPHFEEYDGARVDTQITLLSSQTQGIDNMVTTGALDFGARIQAQSNDPALHFVDGSQNSTVEGLGLQGEPVGTTAILAEDISGDSRITIEDVGIGSRNHPATQGIVVDNVEGLTVTSSTILSGDPVISLKDTTNTTIEDSWLFFRSPASGSGTATDSTGVLVENAESTTLENNKILGNAGDQSHGIEVRDSSQPAILGNTIGDVAVGIFVATSTDGLIEHNNVLLSPLDNFLQQSYGVSLYQGGDHVVDRNTFQHTGQGIRVTDTTGVEADQNRFKATNVGVAVRSLAEDELDGVTDLAMNNGTMATTLEPLVLNSDTENLEVDAECNDWGVYHQTAIDEQRVSDRGDDNDIDAQPFTSPNKDSQDVSCLTPPEANFTADKTSPVTRVDQIDFTDESEPGTYDIEDHAWDFGDGTTSSEQSPSHSYDSVGEFFVELTVTDQVDMTSSKVVKFVVENIPPELGSIPDINIEHNQVASFQAQAEDPETDGLTFTAQQQQGNDTVPLPDGATFTDNGDGTASFDWDPAPGQTGTFTINVTVDDGFDQVTQFVDITVTNEPPVFEPTLPATVGGAVDRLLTLDVNAVDPDSGDTVDTLDVNLSELPETAQENATFIHEDDSTATLAWTPAIGENGTYEVSFNATSPGHETVVDVVLKIREDNVPPTIVPQEMNPPFVDGTQAIVQATATDPDSHTLNWSVSTDEAMAEEDLEVTNQDDSAQVTWDIPAGTSGTFDIVFHVDDGFGVTDALKTIEVEASPFVDARVPIETETGVPTQQPMAGSDLLLSFWAEDPDGALDATNFTVTVDGEELTDQQPERVNPDDTEEPFLWGVESQFTETGVHEVVFEANDTDNNDGEDSITFNVQPNSPPDITVEQTEIWTNATSPAGATVTLAAEAEDPEGREIADDAFTWELPDKTTLNGPEVAATLGVGTHNVQLEVTDPFGESRMQTVTVHVDDVLHASGALDAPEEDGVYQVDPGDNVFEELSGSATVIDDRELGVQGAIVTGTVQYYGDEVNDAGITTATFEITTDSSGEAEFSYDQEILGVQPTALQTSWLSAPGWHEIQLFVVATSRSEAPDQDMEIAEDTIPYYVAPDTAGETGAQASAACYDGPASDENRTGAEDEARLTMAGGSVTAVTPGPANVTEGATAFASQGADCNRGYAEASLLVFNALVQTCYDSEIHVKVNDEDCPSSSEGLPLPPEEATYELASAAVESEGACFYDGEGAHDEGHVTYQLGEGLDTERPAIENVESALSACANALTSGELPEGGSFVAVTGTAGDGALVVEIDTVPATDFATGDDPGPTGVEGEGACYHDGNGAQDSLAFYGPPAPEASGPSVDNVIAGLTACGNAALDGSRPGGGSHARFQASVLGSTVTVSVDSVPVSDTLTP